MRGETKTNPGKWFRTKTRPDLRVLEGTLMAKESWNTVLRAALPRTSDTPREVSVVLSSFTVGFLGPA